MCGIYGAISLGGKIDMSAIKALTWANRERGTDSIGFFDSSGRMIKRACDPAEGLREKALRKWLTNFDGWAIGGHTRLATRGTVCKRNAHPFKKGDIIGSHNGMVRAPKKYKVDSEYLFDRINQSDYQALADVSGYWGLAWLDRRDGCFYLTMHDGELSFTVYEDVVYYSSDRDHLSGIISDDIFDFVEGQVVRFDSAGNVDDSEQSQIPGIDVRAGYKHGVVDAVKAANEHWRNTGEFREANLYAAQGECGFCSGYGTLVYYGGDEMCEYCKYELDYDGYQVKSIHTMGDDEFKAYHN